MTDPNTNSQKKVNSRHLIHCITHPIAITDMANMILTMGCSPIMAEHPEEVAQITSGASALLLNLGNISDTRIEAMKISISIARKRNIPILLDLVGVSASQFRLNLAYELLEGSPICLIKGNYSELISLASGKCTTKGVDTSHRDIHSTTKYMLRVKNRANYILATGEKDILIHEDNAHIISGGDKKMSQITGTGCMLGAVLASSIANDMSLGAIIHSISTYLNAGEQAAKNSTGPGSFRVSLFDALSFFFNNPKEVDIRCERISI